MSDLSLRLGKTIKLKRTNLGLSQEALAAIAGINRTYLGEIERGEVEVSVATLDKIASGLHVELSEFFKLYEETE